MVIMEFPEIPKEKIFPQLICTWFLKNKLKNQFQWTGFLACKNQFRNWFLQATYAVKIKFEIDFVELDFSKFIFQIQGVTVNILPH